MPDMPRCHDRPKCPHCHISLQKNSDWLAIDSEEDRMWALYVCTECQFNRKYVLNVLTGRITSDNSFYEKWMWAGVLLAVAIALLIHWIQEYFFGP